MATEFISREAAISEILSEPTDAHYPSWYAEKLKQIPTADVRYVVLCRDCKHYNPNSMEWKCDYVGGLVEPYEDDFCSYGEADMRPESRTEE